MNALAAWKQQARRLKRETYALYLACRDPRVPWYAKVFAACVVGYAFSPIDLIPDFVPVLGYLDEVILLPPAILLAVRLVPPELMAEHRAAAARAAAKPVSRAGAAVIVGLWLVAATALVWWFWPDPAR